MSAGSSLVPRRLVMVRGPALSAVANGWLRSRGGEVTRRSTSIQHVCPPKYRDYYPAPLLSYLDTWSTSTTGGIRRHRQLIPGSVFDVHLFHLVQSSIYQSVNHTLPPIGLRALLEPSIKAPSSVSDPTLVSLRSTTTKLGIIM